MPQETTTSTRQNASKMNQSTKFSVRIELDEILTSYELESFAEQAETAGHTIRQHFLHVCLGKLSPASAGPENKRGDVRK